MRYTNARGWIIVKVFSTQAVVYPNTALECSLKNNRITQVESGCKRGNALTVLLSMPMGQQTLMSIQPFLVCCLRFGWEISMLSMVVLEKNLEGDDWEELPT